jgi:hypothetical protein
MVGIIKRKFHEKPDPRRWTEKFFKEVPMVDEKGDPLPQNPPLNVKGFWEKPSNETKDAINRSIEELRKRNVERQRKGNKK